MQSFAAIHLDDVGVINGFRALKRAKQNRLIKWRIDSVGGPAKEFCPSWNHLTSPELGV